jgi:hypothetical protein
MNGYADGLQRSLGFTDEELEANRNGYLSERQRDGLAERRKLRGCGTRLAVVAFVVSAALLVGAPLVIGGSAGQSTEEAFRQALPYTLPVAGVFLGVGLFFVVVGYVRSRDLDTGKVSVVEGVVQRSARFIGGKVRRMAYYVTIGGVRFPVQKDEFDAFNDGSYCRVYYVKNPPVGIILSVDG